MSSAFLTYVAAHFPSWALTASVAAVLHHWTMLPWWLAIVIVTGWVGKDLLLFPRRRWLYSSDPPERRIVGRRGTAVTAIAPEGYVRVEGELWHARSQQPLSAGTRVRVYDIEGLRLHVTSER